MKVPVVNPGIIRDGSMPADHHLLLVTAPGAPNEGGFLNQDIKNIPQKLSSKALEQILVIMAGVLLVNFPPCFGVLDKIPCGNFQGMWDPSQPIPACLRQEELAP